MNELPDVDGSGYFLYHSIGMFPGNTERIRNALADISRLWGTPNDAQWERSLGIRNQFLARWSALIGARAGTMAMAENVTTALHSIIGSLPDRYLAGRKVLIAGDCFPSLHFLLSGMAARRRFQVETVAVRPGESWVRDEDFMVAWGPDVGLALLTWVTSTASHRCDLPALIDHGRKQGSLVGIDITQGVGIVPFSVSVTTPDFGVASSLKWLGGVAGAGVLEVREGLLQECHPELRGWFSQENPFAWSLNTFSYARDARRFDHGTPSILAAAACLPALEWHASQDPVALVAHNHALCEELIDGCQGRGRARGVTPFWGKSRGRVKLRLAAGHVHAPPLGAPRPH